MGGPRVLLLAAETTGLRLWCTARVRVVVRWTLVTLRVVNTVRIIFGTPSSS